MQQNQTLLSLSQGDMRELNWQLLVSFDKAYIPSITFFKVGDSGSQVGGTDIIQGTNNVVQEWDKYRYTDYSDRVLKIELTREVEQVSSVTMCYGDITLNNYDDYFTPDGNSPIAANMLPYRPIRIYEGFGNQLVPVFVGLTDATPVIDEEAKTASFHIIDFLYSVADKPLDTMTLGENIRTDEAISKVLVAAGLSSNQLVLDRGYNLLTNFGVAKGTTVIQVLRDLMEAEQGRLYMDEQGVIQFKNRQNYSSINVINFDVYNNILSCKKRREDSIVNVVEIKSAIKTLQINQKVYALSRATLIPANSSADIWADFEGVVTAVDTPVYIDSATTSLFSVNTLSDGTGFANSTSVTLTSTSLFSESYKMTFTNSSSQNLYVTDVQLYGTPYRVTDNIYVRESDASSVSKYDERILSLENDFFQDASSAVSKAKILLDGYSQFAAVSEMSVKGTPQLQLDDPIGIDLFGRRQNARITKIVTSMDASKVKFSQDLEFKSFIPRIYFRVGDAGSQIGGLDYISF